MVNDQFSGGVYGAALQQVPADDLATLPSNGEVHMLMIRRERPHHGHQLNRLIEQQRLCCPCQANMEVGQTPDTGGDAACLDAMVGYQLLNGIFQVIASG